MPSDLRQRCDSDNGWTLWDGFQTSPYPLSDDRAPNNVTGSSRDHIAVRGATHKRRARDRLATSSTPQAIDKRLAGIFANADAAAGLRDARRLAAQLRADHPDAVGSLLEGLEAMFTIAQLGITGGLRRSLTNTKCIESMVFTVRVVTGRLKNWQDGDMKKRWIATGMIEAQHSFRRVRGHTEMGNPRHRHRPRNQPCNTHHLHSRSCLSNTRITIPLQQQAGQSL